MDSTLEPHPHPVRQLDLFVFRNRDCKLRGKRFGFLIFV